MKQCKVCEGHFQETKIRRYKGVYLCNACYNEAINRERCVICGGGLVNLGPHKYCERCGSRIFVVNDDYIEHCLVLIGMLVSNTRYATKEAYESDVRRMLQMHCPMVIKWINQFVDTTEVLRYVYRTVLSQAINIHIGGTEQDDA
jgi:hypothetical protein